MCTPAGARGGGRVRPSVGYARLAPPPLSAAAPHFAGRPPPGHIDPTRTARWGGARASAACLRGRRRDENARAKPRVRHPWRLPFPRLLPLLRSSRWRPRPLAVPRGQAQGSAGPRARVRAGGRRGGGLRRRHHTLCCDGQPSQHQSPCLRLACAAAPSHGKPDGRLGRIHGCLWKPRARRGARREAGGSLASPRSRTTPREARGGLACRPAAPTLSKPRAVLPASLVCAVS